MQKVTLRRQRMSDAKRFYEILSSPRFIYFNRPTSLQDEITFLSLNKEKQRQNFEHSFTILLQGAIVGGCGVKIDQHRPFIGELGYFIDEQHWGRGIASEAIALLEPFTFERLELERLTIMTHTKNIASQRVAVKSGFSREGMLKKAIAIENKLHDAYLYAKIQQQRP
ncbi:N-acetyltransferase [Candidatus Woesearchaeota archaeon CG_4_10_14_0_2_um_filter_57_5]|nr:MAG: hypothetical protein AUJ68_06685 [Candidatus Woesearchaeota archaeon CG1_02_57_44]PIN70058.1 MAG: GNAT family N-acetyltransferase [Candidatus Woesearchaeota archaeon CG11_big_fil_rev_8_21_14_0_20_57_5]PIZ56899.1 MAG: N-acetyltransferase [Candidatus Woesearchaeota archaeon CG_4_10_14_0_2_um_filter_57_5]